jgi:hypothetical protein
MNRKSIVLFIFTCLITSATQAQKPGNWKISALL